MSYDEGLAERIREALCARTDVSERRMFGGLAFLVRGHMCVGIVKENLMVRVGPDAYERLVREPHAHVMDFTGRPMKGLLYVSPEGIESDADLERWIARGISFAGSLPAKASRGKGLPASSHKAPDRRTSAAGNSSRAPGPGGSRRRRGARKG